ncbi:hypothetical protein ABTX82_07565 [Streptomyces lavendulae]|uniref:hypothetical protein n=1 Tax=Streptomyces lavendulae TaxID=1914 RepID=UPI00332E36C9
MTAADHCREVLNSGGSITSVNRVAATLPAVCLISAPSPIPTRAQAGASRADATRARATPGWVSGTPACRPSRTAWETRKAAGEITVPTAVHTAARTTALAGTTT